MAKKDVNARINPFVVAGKIPPQLFCDRKTEAARLVSEVTNGNNLVLISSRRMGKTGLILHCFDMPSISDRFETFYIDILQTSSLKEFTYLLGKEIFTRLASISQQQLRKFVSLLRSISGTFGFDPFSGMPTFNLQIGDIAHPELTLDEIFHYIAQSETMVLIAIDEFQQITNYKEKNVEALLRSHIQRLPNSNFIFAGSERHLLQQMFNESARPFFNSASMMELTPIRLEEYAQFASELFEQSGKRLPHDTIKYVYDLFCGNTFYLQKIFNLAYSKTGPRGDCSVKIADDAIFELLASYDTIYREVLSGVGEAQKQLLIAVAREGNAKEILSAQFLKRHALASASAVQAATKRLIASSLLTRIESTYHVQDPMLRLWLLRTY